MGSTVSHHPNERVWCQNCEAVRNQSIHGRCENCDSAQVVSEHAQYLGREAREVAELEAMVGVGRKP